MIKHSISSFTTFQDLDKLKLLMRYDGTCRQKLNVGSILEKNTFNMKFRSYYKTETKNMKPLTVFEILY